MAAKTHVKSSEVFEKIKIKTQECCSSPKHSNNLLDILSYCETEEKGILTACIKAFYKIFSQFLGNGDLTKVNDLDSKEGKYVTWLNERYMDVWQKLVELLQCQHISIQELALSTLIKLIATEGQNPTTKGEEFPVQRFQVILHELLSTDCNHKDLITRFQEYLDYDDIRYHVLSYMRQDLKQKHSQPPSDVYLTNIFTMLEKISFPVLETKTLTNFLTKPPDNIESAKICSFKEHKKLFSSVWITFLQFKLTSTLYRSVLVILADKVIPFLLNPLLLADFLIESYNIGGAISLLALNGLFILVHKFNLNYPDFYKKLYALFEPSVFHVKYRARFFFLADLFLTSSHLPAYLVAAFAKKLSRLCLTAPAPGLTIAIPFIYNLINRHPNCQVLIHRSDNQQDFSDDPYIFDEPDPAQCKALESSLWELKTLQSHYHPDISKNATKIEHPLQKSEIDLSDLLENNYDQLFERETRKKIKVAPVTFIPPKGLLHTRDDKIGLCWTMD